MNDSNVSYPMLSAMADWQDMTIADVLNRLERTAGRLPALGYKDRLLTFGELVDTAKRVACYLIEAGVGAGDRVAFLMPPGDEWAALHYGAILAGAIAVPVNLALTPAELSFIFQESRPAAVVCCERFRDVALAERVEKAILWPGESGELAAPPGGFRLALLHGRAERPGGWHSVDEALLYSPSEANRRVLEQRQRQMTPASNCAIVFTSGSTGKPKPALLHHRGILGGSWWYGESIGFEPDDRALSPSPTFHVSGLSAGMTVSHMRGLPTWLMEFYDPGTALDIIEKQGITVFTGFDTIYISMMSHPRFSSERVSTIHKLQLSTGPAMYDRVHAAFPNLRTTARCYAMTETCGPSTVTLPAGTSLQEHKYSNGRVLPGVDLTIVDPQTGQPVDTGCRGEIRVKGWHLFNGYADDAAQTEDGFDAEGRFKTGDIGRIDEQNLVYLEGRLKRMIKTGGENVSEREIEMFLEDKIPGVSLAQVVGIPDPYWGEAVIAFVELMPGWQKGEADLRAACIGQIANYKIPKTIHFIEWDAWPRTEAGKISKAELTAVALKRAEARRPAE